MSTSSTTSIPTAPLFVSVPLDLPDFSKLGATPGSSITLPVSVSTTDIASPSDTSPLPSPIDTTPLFEQIVSRLSYPSLVQRGIVPSIFETERVKLPNKRYPKCMYPLDVPLARAPNSPLPSYLEITRRDLYNLFCKHQSILELGRKERCSIFSDMPEVDFEMLWTRATCERLPSDSRLRDKSQFSSLIRDLPADLYSVDTSFQVEIESNSKWSFVKTTLSATLSLTNRNSCFEIAFPKSIKKDSEWYPIVLSALAKFTLARAAGSQITQLGLILPITQRVLIADLSGWDASLLLSEIIAQIPTLTDQLRVHRGFICKSIGYHISKGRNLVLTLESWFSGARLIPCLDFLIAEAPIQEQRKMEVISYLQDRSGLADLNTYPSPPCQIFYRNPEAEYSPANISELTLTAASKVVQKYDGRLFVHTPYILNLARSNINPKALIEDLGYCSRMGGKGVVVHVGKQLKIGKAEAHNNMKRNIISILPYATPSCPLLLETPAGQGTEMLTDVEEMISFVREIRYELEQADELNVECFGMCLDTCHVFASGYDPVWYLRRVELDFPGLIRLIHLNDSKTPCGSRVDRHFPIGGGFTTLLERTLKEVISGKCDFEPIGHIGMSRLGDVIKLAMSRGIPMVIE